MYIVLSVHFAEGVVVWVLHFESHSVAGREVEHYDVAALNVAKPFETVVFPLWRVEVALGVDDRECVLHKRKMDRCVGHARTVSHLVDPKIVAYKKGFFK